VHFPLSELHLVIVLVAVFGILYAVAKFNTFKKVIVGRPMRTRELGKQHTKLLWFIALPILAADLYSSVAYGPEAGMTELAGLGANAKWLILPLTFSTIVLLAILIISYIMGVTAYPDGGGAYAIAKDNFRKPWASLLASSSLLVDYVLTVAVSVSAGIQAIISAYPSVAPHAVTLSILCILVILAVNLRGVAESATIFAWPTFVFMGCMILVVSVGFVNELHHGFIQPHTPSFGVFPKGLTTLLLLKAFSSSCSALTGIETISNAVPIFRDPQAKGAIKAYTALGIMTALTLIGFAYHLYVQGLSVKPDNTMLSQLTGLYLGHGILYHIVIWSTFIVLILAANSTFTGFPQLAAMVAQDRFLPRALLNRGDRLGFSNGMIVLAAFAALLIEAFHAKTNALIPLYAIGVFMSFTIAQIGLVRRWKRMHGRMWRTKLGINAVGATVTLFVAVIFAVTKFRDGAWIILIVIPLMWACMTAIGRHYVQIGKELYIDVETMRPTPHRVVSVVLVSGVHRVVLNTLSFAQSIESEVIALYVGFDDDSISNMRKRWDEWGNPCRLITLKNEYRSLIQPISQLIQTMETWEGGKPDNIHIIVPQFMPSKWWQNILHNQSSLLLRSWFLWHRDVVITTVPYHLRKS